MDAETAEAIDTLRADIQRVDTSLTSEIQRVDTSLTPEIRRVEMSLTSEIQRVETSLTSEIHRFEVTLTSGIHRVEVSLTSDLGALRSEMHELHDDAKRHADVLFESLRDDIRMVAEGVVALSAKIDGRQT